MDFVTIKHPNPEIGDATVPQSAVDHWRSVGWLTEAEYDAHQASQAAGTPPPAGEPTDTPPQGDAAKPTAPKAARGRRSSTEEKD
jgi:hypothetical protein